MMTNRQLDLMLKLLVVEAMPVRQRPADPRHDEAAAHKPENPAKRTK